MLKGFIKRFMAGFKEGYKKSTEDYNVAVCVVDSTLDTYFDFTGTTLGMIKHHRIPVDIFVCDEILERPMMVVSSQDKGLLGINMTNSNDTILVLERKALIEQAQHVKDIHFSVFFLCLLSHELGHIKMNHVHSDVHNRKKQLAMVLPDLKGLEKQVIMEEINEITLKQEKEAWLEGAKYVPASHIQTYDRINSLNFRAYAAHARNEIAKLKEENKHDCVR